MRGQGPSGRWEHPRRLGRGRSPPGKTCQVCLQPTPGPRPCLPPSLRLPCTCGWGEAAPESSELGGEGEQAQPREPTCSQKRCRPCTDQTWPGLWPRLFIKEVTLASGRALSGRQVSPPSRMNPEILRWERRIRVSNQDVGWWSLSYGPLSVIPADHPCPPPVLDAGLGHLGCHVGTQLQAHCGAQSPFPTISLPSWVLVQPCEGAGWAGVPYFTKSLCPKVQGSGPLLGLCPALLLPQDCWGSV